MIFIEIDDDLADFFLECLLIDIPLGANIKVPQSLEKSLHNFYLVNCSVFLLFVEGKDVEEVHHDKIIGQILHQHTPNLFITFLYTEWPSFTRNQMVMQLVNSSLQLLLLRIAGYVDEVCKLFNKESHGRD
jgi:hypothetical protein